MIRDITLGQYYASGSPLHRLDPRTKILGTILFLVEVFLIKDFVGFGVCAAVVLTVVAMSRVPLLYILRGLKPIFIILLFTFFLNVFMVDGKILWQWGFLHVTDQGLYRATFMAIRLILIIIGSSLLTFTTTPIALTDGIERLLRPMAAIGLPAHEIAMMMSIALRFIPLLLEETDKIMKAQQARGADFESGHILRRAKALLPILIPLFLSAFRIAEDLAMAMESRCYRGGKGRTRMKPMRFAARDAIAWLFLLAYLAVVISMRIWL